MSGFTKEFKGKGKKLRVKDAGKDDAGRGIVRIDPDIIEELKLKTGDILEIIHPTSEKKTAALLYPGRIEDKGSNIIRLDASLRRNLGSSMDDLVEIRRIEASLADKVTFAGLEEAVILRNSQQLARKLENRVITKGDILSFYSMGRRVDLIVVDFNPRTDAVRIAINTKVVLSEKSHKELEDLEKKRVTYEDIGGLEDEIQRIREMIELPIRHPELFKRIGIDPPKGVLLHGPPGTGKTLLARAVAYETDAHFITISGPEIMSKFYGQSEENLRKVFEDAKQNAPSIIFIDELDSIAPKRGEVTGEVERRVVAQLLSLMDGFEGEGEIIVIGATNRVNDIDPALRRPGRFDREIEIGVPDREGRLEILFIHTRGIPLADDVDLQQMAEKTHGFVGADVEALAKEAAMIAIREILPEIDLDKPIPPEVLLKIKIKMDHFSYALNSIEPSALREVLITQPTETWDDVGGLEEAKIQLREVIEWPLRYPELYSHLNSKPPSGILLHGPPGTGKTLLARALAHESEVNFISVKGPEFLSKWVGESEKAVRETFRKARSAAPCIIFFDEIDAIAGMRGRFASSQVTEQVVSQLLTEMDGLEGLKDVILLAATNRVELLDPALLRSGRFGRHVEIPMPDLEARKKIFKIHLSNKPIAKEVNLDKLAEKLEGYSGADIQAIAEEATLLTIRRNVPLMNEQKKKIQDLTLKLEELQEKKEKSQKRFHESNDLEKMVKDLKEKVTIHSTQLEKLETEQEAHKEKHYKEQVEEAELEINHLKEKIEEIDNKLLLLKKEQSEYRGLGLNEKINDLKQRNLGFKAELRTLKDERAKNKRLMLELKTKTNKIKDLEEKIQTYKTNLADMKDRLKHLEELGIQDNLDTLNHEIEEIENNLEEHSSQFLKQVEISQEEIVRAMEKIMKSANEAMKAYKAQAKEPVEDIYR
jgi:transitional endoplasmic reticulum ATPase